MEYNPFDPAVKDNPYPYYAYLREHAPVYQVEGMGCWAISRYADVDFVLKNPKLFSSEILFTALLGDMNPVPEAPSLIASDPPVHTRMRKLINKAFTPRLINSLGPRVREITLDLLQQVMEPNAFDLVHDLSSPLPVILIAEMLGVEPDRRDDFKRWSDDIVSAANRMYSPEEEQRIRKSIDEFRTYFQETIEARRKAPREDLITGLVKAEEEDQVLTSGEVLGLAVLLLVAGNETTTNLLGNTMLALLSHPDQLAKVQADRALIPNTVEEALRYDGPVQGIFRQAVEDIDLAGTTIPAGSMVLPLFASANHDATKFPDPERFDVTRLIDSHLAFGFGIHFCLGAQLARIETQIALEELFSHFRAFTRTEETLTRVDSFFLRGLKTFPLQVEAA